MSHILLLPPEEGSQLVKVDSKLHALNFCNRTPRGDATAHLNSQSFGLQKRWSVLLSLIATLKKENYFRFVIWLTFFFFFKYYSSDKECF